MTRPGFTLHELLISLGVMAGVIALAAHAATAQLRFFSGSGELAALRSQVGHASAIAAALLSGASAPGGDILVALDSAIELEVPIATSFVCAATPGVVTMAAPTPRGNTLASFSETPGPGDRLQVLFSDSIGSTWLTVRPASVPTASSNGCNLFPTFSSSFTLTLLEQTALPPGAPLRFSRRTRISLYRGSDSRWYLGSRTWSAEAQSFNTVQPVAGPLRPYDQAAGRTGLLFEYRGTDGAPMSLPVDGHRVASVRIAARSRSARYEDSATVTLALRNAP